MEGILMGKATHETYDKSNKSMFNSVIQHTIST